MRKIPDKRPSGDRRITRWCTLLVTAEVPLVVEKKKLHGNLCSDLLAAVRERDKGIPPPIRSREDN